MPAFIANVRALCALMATMLAAAHLCTATARAQVHEALDQGWGPAQQQRWYDTTQGSRLIPLDWLRALEQPSSSARFLAPDHIESFRYLSRAPGRDLPVGFVVDGRSDARLDKTRLRWRRDQGDAAPWVGMTCAACHTADITYAGRRLRVDGAPALTDFQGFMSALNGSLKRTLAGSEPSAPQADRERWNRFAAEVLAGVDDADNRSRLAGALTRHVTWNGRLEEQSATALRYGYGRLDAVGHILNKVALVLDDRNARQPADAPVSYPFIWNAPQHDLIQWNGIAENSRNDIEFRGQPTDLRALGRNAGEVIGVFGDIKAGDEGNSSIHINNLIHLERMLGTLRPPRWPTDVLPPIDADKRDRGRTLFVAHCASCHTGRDPKGPAARLTEQMDRADLKSPVFVTMTPFADVQTDVWMACNAFQFKAAAGPYAGRSTTGLLYGETMRGEGDLLLTGMVMRALRKDLGAFARNFGRDLFEGGKRLADIVVPPPPSPRPPIIASAPDAAAVQDKALRKFECIQAAADRAARPQKNTLAYKARPLHGIWATPPYLHNGSVPTLYDLLLPSRYRSPAATSAAPRPPGPYRPDTFYVGTREYDPVKVGFVTARSASGNTFEFRVLDSAGREIEGNANYGHEYGIHRLTEQDRWDLVEYMKSL